MVGWMIVPQTEKGAKVSVKRIRCRPSSPKELEETGRKLQPMWPPTLRLLFKYASGDGIFKITLQRRKGRYRLNLHEPVTRKRKQVPSRSTRYVTITTDEWVEVKESSGTKPWSIFFCVTLPGRVRSEAFVEAVQEAFLTKLAKLRWPPP